MRYTKVQKLASHVIDELGGITKVARLCNIAPSSVFLWRKNGIPEERENFLRSTYPDLRAWTWDNAGLLKIKAVYEQNATLYKNLVEIYEQKLSKQA